MKPYKRPGTWSMHSDTRTSTTYVSSCRYCDKAVISKEPPENPWEPGVHEQCEIIVGLGRVVNADDPEDTDWFHDYVDWILKDD
jgi:hypothetical protein